MAFHNENIVLRDAVQFRQYLNSISTMSWSPIGATFHNTYIPNIRQWRGHESMLSMQRTYMQKTPPWDRGPHIYVAKGAPDPNDDGIWVMTRPDIPGIHAGACNPDMFGCELVGDFNAVQPNNAQLDLLTDAIAELFFWADIKVANINAHRDCIPGRTCPGQAFYDISNRVVGMVMSKITMNPEEVWALWGTEYPLPKTQRAFGIPSAWFANMTGSGTKLGAAKSYPVYSGNTVTQLFVSGQIVYRNSASRIVFYNEFRVP